MITVAFVNSTKKWGGVKTHTISFGEKLVGSGHKVLIYARDDRFLSKSNSCQFHTHKVDFGVDYSPLSIAYFYREFKRQNVNVLIANVGKDMTTAGIAARLLGIPVVQHIGAHLDMLPKLKYKILHNFLKPIFFCSSEYIGEYFMKTVPWVKADSVKVILNGKVPGTEELKTHSPRRLVATQQLNADKGHDTLLKAIAKISSQPLEFHIVGTGTHEEELKLLSNKLGLQDKVIWHGFTTDVDSILAESDIFLLASLMEGLPNTLLEALSSGLMPICRSVAGNYEVWPDELQEYLLPYEADENVFAEAISKALALSDEELLAAKHHARKACEEKCNLNLLSKQFEEWLVELTARNNKAKVS